MNNDISLLKLAKTLTFSEAVRPVCLTPNDLVFFNEKATVIGWGKKHEKDNFGTSVLNKADVRVIPMMSCRNDYKFYPEMITSRMFCAAGKITDGCQGDSGGPLVWKDGETDSYVQIGVTSWGIGCGRKDFPGVYVKLIKFLGWIYDRTKDSAFCSSYTPTPDVEISSNGKQKNNKKRGKKSRNGSERRRRRRKKKGGDRWWRRENEGKGRGNRRGSRKKNSGGEESESESKEDGRGRTEAKRGRRKLRRRQKQEDQDDENDSKENGENRRRNLYRNRGPNLGGKKRNKRKSKNGRIMHSEKANNFNGKIRSGSFKKNFQNGKLFVG
nr:serine protease 55-like [Penaeus vannamei]